MSIADQARHSTFGERLTNLDALKNRGKLANYLEEEMDVQREIISSNFEEWLKGSRIDQVDDVCILGVRI